MCREPGLQPAGGEGLWEPHGLRPRPTHSQVGGCDISPGLEGCLGAALSVRWWRRRVRVASGRGRGLAPCLLFPIKLNSRSAPLWGSPTFQVAGHPFLWALWPLWPQQSPFSRSSRCSKHSAEHFAPVDCFSPFNARTLGSAAGESPLCRPGAEGHGLMAGKWRSLDSDRLLEGLWS